MQDADEAFLVLKDFGLDANGELLTPDPSPQIMQGREGDLVLVNGELNPTFRIPRDGLLRLRFLNASVARYYRLQLEDHPSIRCVSTLAPTSMSSFFLPHHPRARRDPGGRPEALTLL